MIVDVSGWEFHNVYRDGDGALRTRPGFAIYAAAPSGTRFVAGFSLQAPQTTDVWHYLFEQDTATLAVTLRVCTEEFFTVFSMGLGVMEEAPVITWASVNRQVMINSPSFSAPLFGVLGGGLMTALKRDSDYEDTTALDIPAGHITTFGDRMPIAQGSTLFFNDPGIDPRTYVAENIVALPGVIYDLTRADDGALWIFTSEGVYTLAADALGQGQQVQGFLSRVPGLLTSKSRNAVSTQFGVAVLDRDAVVVGTRRIPVGTYKGRRLLSQAVEVEDLRQFGELYATPRGVLVGFRGDRNLFLDIDLQDGTVTYCWAESAAFDLVGTLRGRDGELLHMFSGYVVEQTVTGTIDYDGDPIAAVVAGRLDLGPLDWPIIRRVSVSAANGGANVAAACSGNQDTANATTVDGDIIIGTSPWAASGTKMAGRTTRSTRTTLNVRASEPNAEVRVDGGDRRVIAAVEVQTGGVGRRRKEKMT